MVNDEQQPRGINGGWSELVTHWQTSINPEQVRNNLQLRWKFALLPFDCKRVPRVLVVPLMPNNDDFFVGNHAAQLSAASVNLLKICWSLYEFMPAKKDLI